MKIVKMVVGRNITLFLQNKKNVVLSFFSIVIVLGLYAIFLRDFIIQSVLEHGLTMRLASEFTDRMMVGGLLVVLNTTTCFGIMQIRVSDIQMGIKRDYLVAPIKEYQLTIGYWLTGVIVSGFFTCFTLIMSECYFLVQYDNPMTGILLLKAIGMAMLCSVMNCGILMLLTSVIKDTTTFSTFGNLYGMMSGFLAGTYLPYSLYPDSLKKILFFYPPTHLTSIMRRIYLSMYTIGEENPQFVDMKKLLYQNYGVSLTYRGEVCKESLQWILLGVAMALIAFILLYKPRANNVEK